MVSSKIVRVFCVDNEIFPELMLVNSNRKLKSYYGSSCNLTIFWHGEVEGLVGAVGAVGGANHILAVRSEIFLQESKLNSHIC